MGLGFEMQQYRMLHLLGESKRLLVPIKMYHTGRVQRL